MGQLNHWITKIFKGNSKWRAKHESKWEPELLIKDEGFTVFQDNLKSKTEKLLTELEVDYSIEVSNHVNEASNKNVKLISYKLLKMKESMIWIYHDMAEYNIKDTHHIFEKWGYLTPLELSETFILSLQDELSKKT